MTTNKDVKKRIRNRQAKTGEAYSTAHVHVMNERAALLAPDLPTGTLFDNATLDPKLRGETACAK